VQRIWSLQNSDDLSGGVTIGAVIRALGQVAVNGVAIVPRSHANATGRKGLALYPVMSMMNHACVPATQLDWQVLKLLNCLDSVKRFGSWCINMMALVSCVALG